MKKLALVALFAVAAFGMAFAADPSSGSVVVTGTVTPVFSIDLSATTYAMDIADGTTSQTFSNITTATVKSNVKNWTISLTSAHPGTNGVGYLYQSNEEKISYTASLTGLANSATIGLGGISESQPRTAKAGNEYPLSITVSPDTTTYSQSGTYSDTITITISHS